MKILAIRGRNLASLHGDFELDFSAEPLFGCGLFTITGETGAGKSTILDAMCLALYGRYPRITSEGPKDKVENSWGEALLNSDPRTILRTGSSQGFAEVDLMVDDKTLRANWQVRRARGTAEGNLQAFERSLIDLQDGSVLASGKKSVDEEITQRLKLTYDQFRRTVLLAQNDFDAFLRATDSDRADLLEKITGTELYSKISAKAFERERQALRTLEDLQQKTGFIKVLPEEERQQLRTLIENTEQSHKKLQKRNKKASADFDWYVRREEAQGRLQEASEQAKLAIAKLEAAADQKQLLVKIDIATSLQPLMDKADGSKTTLEGFEKEQTLRLSEQAALQRALIDANKQMQLCRELFESAEKNLDDATPSLEQAQKLDMQISSRLRRQTDAQDMLEQAVKRRKESNKKSVEHEQTGKQMRARLEKLEAALKNNAAIEPVSKRAKDLQRAFLRLKELQADLEQAKQRQSKTRKNYDTLQKRMQSDKTAKQAHNVELADLRKMLDKKTQILAGMKPDEVRLKRDQQIDYQNQLSLLHQHLGLVVDQKEVIWKTSKSRSEAEDKVVSTNLELAELKTALADLNSRAIEADDIFSRSKSILSKHVLELRAGLHEGEACAVCGSIDHPGHDDEATSRVLDQMRERTAELAKKITGNEKKSGKVRQAIEHANARIESADERLGQAQLRLENLQARTLVLYAQVSLAATPLNLKITKKRKLENQHTHIGELLEANEHHTINIRKQLMNIQHLEVENRTLGEQVFELEQQVQDQLGETERLVADWQKVGEEMAKADGKLRQLTEHHDVILEQILSMLGGVDLSRADLLRDLGSAEQFLQKEIEGFDGQKKEADEIKSDLNARKSAGAVLSEKIEQQGSRIIELEKDLADIAEGLKENKKQRAGLFDGEAVVVVRQRLKDDHQRTTKDLQETRTACSEKSTRLEEVEKNLSRLKTSLKRAVRDREKAFETRNSALEDKGLKLEELNSLRSIADEKISAMRSELEQLQQNQTRSKALLTDRLQHLEQLEKQTEPEKSKQQLVAELSDIEADRAMLMVDLGKNKSLLELDDAGLKQRAKLSGKIEKVEKNHELWAIISGAIGSKDGAKFRRFAQGVTLDHLIALANVQLRNINPRYKIERNTIGGLGLQVLDVEMGGEIRSVRSLSGGERFLVSLALALGLSQLDGRSSFVDTLMIDEGFGALDARSLDIVIEALESLQSQGRKVGVISHIEALTDRIPVQIKVEKQGNGRSRVRVMEQGFGGGA
jgi:DNA repair protein SbcC/Rad50